MGLFLSRAKVPRIGPVLQLQWGITWEPRESQSLHGAQPGRGKERSLRSRVEQNPCEASSELLLVQASFSKKKEAIPKKLSKEGQKWELTNFLSNILCASSIFHKQPSRDQKTENQREGAYPVNEGQSLALKPIACLPSHCGLDWG